MNKPSRITPAAPTEQHVSSRAVTTAASGARLPTFADNFERNAFYAALGNRAAKIAQRIMPVGEAAHGWFHTEAFIEGCKRRCEQERLYKRIFWMLVARHGARPAIPAEHLTGWALAEQAAVGVRS